MKTFYANPNPRWLSLAALSFLIFVSGADETVGQLLTPIQKNLDVTVVGASQRLLTTDWERGPKLEKQSQSTFGQAGTDNQVLLLAYALNRMLHNNAREAKDVANEMTIKYPSNLDGWMLKAWLSALTNNYDVACINMRSLKQAMSNSKVTPASEQNIYKRFGRMVGYMQGPINDRVNADVLDATILAIANGASKESLAVFNDSREETLKKFDELLKEQATKSQAELAKVQAKNDQDAINLEKQNQLLTQTESQLIPEKEKVREAARQQISALERDGRSIEIQLGQISTDIRITQRNLENMYASLYQAQNVPPGYQVSTYNLSIQIRNAELSLASLQNNGVGLSNQLGSIRNQIGQARNAANQRIRELDKEMKKVSSTRKRNMNKLAAIAKGPKIADGKRNAMQNKATSLRTFDDIPLELYRQELLDALK